MNVIGGWVEEVTKSKINLEIKFQRKVLLVWNLIPEEDIYPFVWNIMIGLNLLSTPVESNCLIQYLTTSRKYWKILLDRQIVGWLDAREMASETLSRKWAIVHLFMDIVLYFEAGFIVPHHLHLGSPISNVNIPQSFLLISSSRFRIDAIFGRSEQR